MDDLHLVGLTDDGEHLVLAATRGQQFRLPLDDRLLAAIRGDLVRLGQLQVEVESQLRPAEIQARIRAGESAEQVALAAGIPVDRVRRYEGPVLAEREHIAGLARRTPARRRGDGFVPALGDLVEQRLAERGLGHGAARWDACRRDDATWTVSVTVADSGSDQVRARWAFDPRRGLLTPQDDEAQRLSAEEPLPAPAPPPAERTSSRRLSSVPNGPSGPSASTGASEGPTVDDLAREPSDVPDVEPDVELTGRTVTGPSEENAQELLADDPGDESSEDLTSAPATQEQAPARPSAARPGPARHSSRGRRASVPAWDDIVFGTRPKE